MSAAYTPDPHKAIRAQVKAIIDMPTDPALVDRQRDILSIVGRIDVGRRELEQLATDFLNGLRAGRAYDRLYLAASEMADRGLLSPFSNRMKIQSLIEHGLYDQAFREIRRARSDHGHNRAEMAELAGLEGRIHKQIFVLSHAAGQVDVEALICALEAYERGWVLTDRTSAWHGANLAALVRRAEAAKLDVRRRYDLQALAQSVIAAAEQERRDYPDEAWPLASKGEASLALGRDNEALMAYGAYVKHAKVDAFALAGTHRQLREIWQEDTSSSALQAILDGITAALLENPKGMVEFAAGELPQMARRMDAWRSGEGQRYERLFGARPMTIRWALRLAEVAKCVGRIDQDGPLGVPAATGFAIDAHLLCEAWRDHGAVLVTNEHVINKRGEGALRREDAVVRFTQADTVEPLGLGEVLWSSDREDHDITVLSLRDHAHRIMRFNRVAPLQMLKEAEAQAPGDIDGLGPVTVLGHPAGSESLHLAIENLDVVRADRKREDGHPERVWYRCPTTEGSSGSPVLTWRSLEATAVHHKSIDQHVCNEGVSINSIQNAIKLRPNGWSVV